MLTLATEAPSVIVLAQARTRTERRLIHEWARAHHSGAKVVDIDRTTGAEDWPGGATLVPVRVSWSAAPASTVRAGEMLAHLTPRLPFGPLQAGLIKRSPGWADVVDGDPATVATLRARWDAETGGLATFATFVAPPPRWPATAPSALIGDRYKVPRAGGRADHRVRARFREQVDAAGQEVGQARRRTSPATRSRASTSSRRCRARLAIDAFRTVLCPMHAPDLEGPGRHREPRARCARRTASTRSSSCPPTAPTSTRWCSPRCCTRTTSRATTCSAANNMSFWPIGPLGKRAGRHLHPPQLRRRRDLQVRAARVPRPPASASASTSSGTSRAAGPAPASCARRARAAAYLVRALRGRAAPRTSSWSPSRSSTTSCTRSARWPPSRAARPRRRRAPAGWPATSAAQLRTAATPGCASASRSRCARRWTEAGEGPARLEKVAFRICDGINRATPVTPTVAGHLRAARAAATAR